MVKDRSDVLQGTLDMLVLKALQLEPMVATHVARDQPRSRRDDVNWLKRWRPSSITGAVLGHELAVAQLVGRPRLSWVSTLAQTFWPSSFMLRGARSHPCA